MKKMLLTIACAGLLTHGANLSAEEIHQHDADVKEILGIHAKMTEIDRMLLQNPDDPSLNHAMKELEAKLVAKMKTYNAMRKEAVESIPAAGATD
jgi:hypothetical protein